MSALALLRGVFDVDNLKIRLAEAEEKLKEENIWSNQELSSKLLKEQKEIKSKLENLSSWKNILDDSTVAIELEDEALILETKNNLKKLQQDFDKFDLENMLNGEYDNNNCYLEIHPGAGGTESCDWANMLLRMYQRFCDKISKLFPSRRFIDSFHHHSPTERIAGKMRRTATCNTATANGQTGMKA